MSNGDYGAAQTPKRIFAKHCLDCHYVLDGLDTQRCPECGRAFNISDPETYTTKPPLVRWKLWFPGVAIALISGLLVVVLLDLVFGTRGWGLWIGVPFAVAAIAGYRLKHFSRALFWFMLITCMAGLLIGLVAFGAAGVFCLIILFGIFCIPLIVGALTGYCLRITLKRTRFSQAEHLPVLALLAVPILIALLEGPAHPGPVEQVQTSSIVHAPLDRAWDAMMFYEEVTHDPPLILRIGLAHPTTTIGSSQSIGDVKTCLYNKGHITKQVTHIEPLERLEFRIVEQSIGYEKDVVLRGGRFEFEAIDDEHTRITLVTGYHPLLTPRFAWRPGERYAIHTLHDHVIEGMRREAELTLGEFELAAGSASP